MRSRVSDGIRPDSALLLGIDLGTTGAKALLVDVSDGVAAGRGYCAYSSVTSVDGAHEQSPEEWWAATVHAVHEAVSGIAPTRVRAIGLSGHMHALLLVDEGDRPVRPALTWADRRCAPQVRRLRQTQSAFTALCANPVVEAFTAPKLAWLAELEPASLGRAVRLIQPKDMLRHRLTGTWGTDTTDACGTLLYDVRRHRWDESLWRLCGASSDLGPEVVGSSDAVGGLTPAAATELGLSPHTPVVAGAGDVSCSALGAGVVEAGTVYVNAGTAAQILAPLDEPLAGDHFIFGRAGSAGYLAMASVYAAGLSVDWAARSMMGGSPGMSGGAQLDAMAAGEPAGAGGAVFVPHLLGTSVPTHDPETRGALLGLAADHASGTVARAVLEGVAYACAAAVAHVGSLVGGVRRVRVGGGLSASSVWGEALAAVHDVPVERVTGDASAIGAAMLAGVGLGAWADGQEAAQACVGAMAVEPPESRAVERYRVARSRYEEATHALLDLSRRFNTRAPEQEPVRQAESA